MFSQDAKHDTSPIGKIGAEFPNSRYENRISRPFHISVLEMFKRNPKRVKLLKRNVTVDETWIYYYSPEIKRNKQKISLGKRATKKAKTV